MTNFLNLPFDIRATIIDIVIRAEREHLTQFYGVKGRGRRCGSKAFFEYWKDIWYEGDPEAYVTSAYGLLSTNKQINQETNKLLAKVPTMYKLDVALMDGRLLWPTWTFLSRKTNDVDLIEATLQVRGPSLPCCIQWQGTNTGVRRIAYKICSFLEHYYEFGVQGPPNDDGSLTNKKSVRNLQPSYTIKVFDLDCIESDEPRKAPRTGEGAEEKQEECEHLTRCSRVRHPKLYAQDLYKFLHIEIHRLLKEGDGHTQSGHPIYAAIDKIKLRVNGELKAEINLTEWLLKLPNEVYGCDVSAWRRQAIQLKKDNGFEVPENIQQYDDIYVFEEELSDAQYRYEDPKSHG